MADELGTFAGDALRILHDLLTDTSVDYDGKPTTPASVRVDVAKYLLDQFLGKAKTNVDVNSDSPLIELMGGILINPDGAASHQIIKTDIIDLVDDDEDGPGRPMLG